MISVIFDTETTGLLKNRDVILDLQPRIIEFSALKVNEFGFILDTFSTLINPQEEISAKVMKITDIKQDDLRDQPTFSELQESIKEFFDGCDRVIAHNFEFDHMMLKNEFNRVGVEFDLSDKICVCTLAEYEYMNSSYTPLSELYALIMGKPMTRAHRAMDDAMAVLEILRQDGFFRGSVS